MKTSRVLIICMLLALAVQGCAIIDYTPDPERTMYVAAKTAVYGLWRSGVSIDRLRTAKAPLEALQALLNASDEAVLDEGLAGWLRSYVEQLPFESDRVIVGEMVDAALAAFQLSNPAILQDKRKEIAVWIVGGMFDGIALAEEEAGWE